MTFTIQRDVRGNSSANNNETIRQIIAPGVTKMRVLVDAVCLRVLCRENLLVAIGNRLMLAHLTPDGNTLHTFAPLPRLRDKIHGIERCPIGDDEYLIVFHAGREAYSLTLDCNTHQFSECERIVIREEACLLPVPFIRRRVNDWISSIALLSPAELCMVTSHGVAVLLKRNEKSGSLLWNMEEKCACDDGSTLYCSLLVGRKWEEVTCFSGTALGLLLVWSVSGSEANRGKVLKSVSAHNGVIFSIACDLESGLLTTTSDDRSVKFWNLDLAQSQKSDGTTVELREQRYCFSHTARVFQCRLIKNGKRILVASIGEDAYLCLWNTDGDLLLKKRLDDGPTLWSMDYDEETSTIFVTASNGNMHKYFIHQWMFEKTDAKAVEQTGLTGINPELSPNEHLAKVRFALNGSLITVTNRNLIMILDINGTVVHNFGRFEQLKCSIIETGSRFLYLAGGCHIYLHDITVQEPSSFKKAKEILFNDKAFQQDGVDSVPNGIIRSLNYCVRTKSVAVCDANGCCIVFDESLSETISCHRLPMPSAERWLTAFLILDNVLMLMADRSGHLYLFDRGGIDPVFKLLNVHGKLGITSISVVSVQEQTTNYRLLTTGHDSRICEIFLDSARKTLVAENSIKTCLRWIDRTVSLHGKRCYLGFNDNHFLMINDRNDVFTQFECGGGHRSWDYHYDEPSDTFTYVFIQHKKLKKMQYTPQRDVGSALCLPRHDWHTRACNAFHVCYRSDGHLFISGGEDNLLRINSFVNGEILEEPRKYIFNHISSIKTIVIKELPESDSIIIVSAGGRAQICVTCLESESFHVKQRYTYMLLESDAERSRWKTNRRSNIDPETKFMCAAFIDGGRLVFGCSDGFVRVYDLLCTDGQWAVALVSESFYGRCILKVISVVMHDKPLFITMATDGLLCFWDPTIIGKPFYRHRVHDSGINSVDFEHVGTDKLKIATGGDDQSVTVTLFEIMKVGDTFEMGVMHAVCEKYLHTAQVTGIKLIDNDKMISVGVDQHIYISDFSGYSKLQLISSTNTCVADVKGLSLISGDNQLVVYGCGIEIISLDEL